MLKWLRFVKPRKTSKNNGKVEESGVRPYIEIWLLSLRFEMNIVLMVCKMCFEVEQSRCAQTKREREK